MSELKAEQWLDYAGEPRPCYPKSEADKVIAHHEYKRCLAMAKLCHWKMGVFIYKKEKNDFYYRWYKRWLELAKKFKEGLVIGVDKATGTDKTVVINYKEAK